MNSIDMYTCDSGKVVGVANNVWVNGITQISVITVVNGQQYEPVAAVTR
jgi:hypothetical protein